MFDPALIFSSLDIQDEILIKKITDLVKPKLDSTSVENYLSNKKLYPQSVPSTKLEMNIDLYLYKEFIKRHPDAIYNSSTAKISSSAYNEVKKFLLFDSSLINRYGDIKKLVLQSVEAIPAFYPVTQILISSEQGQIIQIGTLVKPKSDLSKQNLEITLDGRKVTLNLGKIYLIPLKGQNIELKLDDQTLKVTGGELGVVFDLKQKYE